MANEFIKIDEVYELVSLSAAGSNKAHTSAAITIKNEGELKSDASLGNGVMDAIFKAIDRSTGTKGVLKDYQVRAVSSGKDAMAKVTVKVKFEGAKTVTGHGLDVDTATASAKAYLNALNSYLCKA